MIHRPGGKGLIRSIGAVISYTGYMTHTPVFPGLIEGQVI